MSAPGAVVDIAVVPGRTTICRRAGCYQPGVTGPPIPPGWWDFCTYHQAELAAAHRVPLRPRAAAYASTEPRPDDTAPGPRPAEHGSERGYHIHRRAKEEICGACWDAHQRHLADLSTRPPRARRRKRRRP